MKEAIWGICIGILIVVVVSPYFELWNLHLIANSLESIDAKLQEISKQLNRIAEKEDEK